MSDFDKYYSSHESGFPVDIRKLIADDGVELREFSDLPEGIAGQIQRISDSGRFAISTSKDDSKEWRTYIMAHELGHYALHKSLIGNGLDDNRAFFSTDVGNYSNKKIGKVQEKEAHIFACAVLMPEEKIEQLFDEKDDPTNEEVVEFFGVPAGVLAWWINVLFEDDDESA